jgi:hypothetical protein
MDDQTLWWILLIVLIACCLIPMILMRRMGRSRPHERTGARPGPGAVGQGNGSASHEP